MHQNPAITRGIEPMLFLCWADVQDCHQSEFEYTLGHNDFGKFVAHVFSRFPRQF